MYLEVLTHCPRFQGWEPSLLPICDNVFYYVCSAQLEGDNGLFFLSTLLWLVFWYIHTLLYTETIMLRRLQCISGSVADCGGCLTLH